VDRRRRAGFVAWDRSSPASEFPDRRLLALGAVLAGVGAVATMVAWWLVAPPIVFLAGCTLIVTGRHRTVTATY
jgi:hypothetical protein